MATGWKNVHIFISSTFNDMHAERDYLVKRVFPQLREWCEQRKLRLVDIDLRWGVTEEDATRNRNVVRTCLERIDHCRPFFVCFLGQRRGWVPEPEHIGQDTRDAFPELTRHVGNASVTELEILHALIHPLHGQPCSTQGEEGEPYRRAEHAFFYLRQDLPPLPDLLRPTYTNEGSEHPVRDDAELAQWRDHVIPAETTKWHRPLHRYRAAWLAGAATPELAMPVECPSMDVKNQARWREAWRNAGVRVADSDLAVPPGEMEKAEAFNEQLTKGRLGDFRAETGEELAEVMLRELQGAIEQRHPGHQPVEQEDPLQHEIDQHEEFLYTNSEGFIQRTGDFGDLDGYLDDDVGRRMFVLTAPGGMGKSMLLANWVHTHRDESPNADTAFVCRFVGQSDGSSTVTGLLRSIMLELQYAHHRIPQTKMEAVKDPGGQEERREVPFEIPQDPAEVHNMWREVMEHLGDHGKTVIVMDAINQLESGLENLSWLPFAGLPPNVKLIVSFREGAPGSEELMQQWAGNPNIQMSQVEPFDDLADRRKLVKAYLGQFLKELDKNHRATLIQSEGAGNPLFLKVVLSELRVLGAFAQLGDVIRTRFGTTPESAFQAVLHRLQSDPAYSALPPAQAVPLIFGLLAHARRGLSADELAALLRANAHAAPPTATRRLASDDFEKHQEHERKSGTDASGGVPGTARRRRVCPWLFSRDSRPVPPPSHTSSGTGSPHNAGGLTAPPLPLTHDDALETVYLFLRQVRPFLARRNGLHDFFYESFKTAAISRYAHEPETTMPTARPAKAWHGLIAEHFDAQTNYEPSTGGHPQRQPHVRKVDELPWQLARAERHERLEALLTTFDFLQAKLDALGPQPVIDDYDLTGCQRNDPLGLIQGAVRLSAHILAHDTSLLAQQLHGRLADFDEPVIRALLQIARPRPLPWLRPTTATLATPGGPLLRTFLGHERRVNAAAISPDGKHAVSASDDKTLKLWDLDTGACTNSLKGHEGAVKAIAISPDGGYAISGSDDTTLRLWDLGTGTCTNTLKGHEESVNAVAISSDGRRAISGGGRQSGTKKDFTLRLWNLDTGSCTGTLKGHEDAVNAVAISPDGKHAISASDDTTLKLWNLGAGTCTNTLKGHEESVNAIAISSDGRQAISGGGRQFGIKKDFTLKLWDLDTGSCTGTLKGHEGAVNAVAISPDGKHAISASDDRTLKFWDLAPGTCTNTLMGHEYAINTVAIAPDGKCAISGSWDGTLNLWNLDVRTSTNTPKGHRREVETVGIAPDGKRAISASCHTSLKLWDLDNTSRTKTLKGYLGWASTVAIAPDGKRAISGSIVCTLKLWNLEQGTLIKTLEGHRGHVHAVAIAPNGKRAISGSGDSTLKLWDLEQGALIKTLEGHSRRVDAVAITPDGKHAISGSNDMTVKLWDLEQGALINTFEGHSRGVAAVASAPDGKRAISGSWDRTLKLWDLEQGILINTFEGHSCGVNTVAIAPDGKHAISGSADYTLRFWDLDTGNCITGFTGDGAMHACAFAPDGRTVVAGDGLGRVHFLRIEE